MERLKAENILAMHKVARSSGDHRTAVEIAEQIVRTGSPAPSIEQPLDSPAPNPQVENMTAHVGQPRSPYFYRQLGYDVCHED